MGKYEFTGGINATNLQIGDHNTMHTSFNEVQINWETLEGAFHKARIENKLSDKENELLIQGKDLAKTKDSKGLINLVENNLPMFCQDLFNKIVAPGLVELIKVLLHSL